MTNFEIRIATAHDIPALVTLANQYTYQNLPEQDRESGFLTGVFSDAAVRAMIHSAPSIVAYNQQDLAGFVINTKLPPQAYPPLVQAIIKTLPNLHFQDLPVAHYPYFFYGPVLVARKYRHQGLLRQMFLKTKAALKSQFNFAIAFIDQANAASYQIHTEHLGFTPMGSIAFNNRLYAILAAPIK